MALNVSSHLPRTLKTLSSTHLHLLPRPRPRTFHTSHPRLNPGLTNILDDLSPTAIRIHTITSAGHIELSTGVTLTGPCIFLGGKVFLWDVPLVKLWEGWSVDMFKIFEVVVPKPEMLLFGTGHRTLQLPPPLRTHLSRNGIQCDMMDTRNACSTYNLLTEEGRNVAAALLPLSQTSWKKTSLP